MKLRAVAQTPHTHTHAKLHTISLYAGSFHADLCVFNSLGFDFILENKHLLFICALLVAVVILMLTSIVSVITLCKWWTHHFALSNERKLRGSAPSLFALIIIQARVKQNNLLMRLLTRDFYTAGWDRFTRLLSVETFMQSIIPSFAWSSNCSTFDLSCFQAAGQACDACYPAVPQEEFRPFSIENNCKCPFHTLTACIQCKGTALT